MPKGQFPKLKGSICNVPIDVEDVANTLPRSTNDNGFLIVKLKRKLEYRGHVVFEPIRPDFIQHILSYLKENNPLYHDIQIDVNNINDESMVENATNVLEETNSDVDRNVSTEDIIEPVGEQTDDSILDELETATNPLDAPFKRK